MHRLQKIDLDSRCPIPHRVSLPPTGTAPSGWQIPQPWVTDADGARVRLDDLLGGQWAVLHIGRTAGAAAKHGRDAGVPTVRVVDPTLVRWLRRRKAAAVVLRPDGFIYAAAGSGRPLPPPPVGYTGNSLPTRAELGPAHDHRPTLIEHTIYVAGKPIFVAETGSGPPVVMLHGGGPGASGVSNYSRNIDALARHFRVIVPDMPGYGRSAKGVDQSDPFGYLADMIRGLLDELGVDTAHLIGNSYGGAAALRLALDTPHRVDKLVLMGPGGIGTTRAAPTAGLKSLLSYYGGDGPSRDKLEAFIRNYLVYDGASVPDDLIDLRYAASHRSRGGRRIRRCAARPDRWRCARCGAWT